jgi:hypothetical protein
MGALEAVYGIRCDQALATTDLYSVRAPPTPTPVLSLSPPTEISTAGLILLHVAMALCTGSSRNVLNGSRLTLPESYVVYACTSPECNQLPTLPTTRPQYEAVVLHVNTNNKRTYRH